MGFLGKRGSGREEAELQVSLSCSGENQPLLTGACSLLDSSRVSPALVGSTSPGSRELVCAEAELGPHGQAEPRTLEEDLRGRGSQEQPPSSLPASGALTPTSSASLPAQSPAAAPPQHTAPATCPARSICPQRVPQALGLSCTRSGCRAELTGRAPLSGLGRSRAPDTPVLLVQ